MAFFEQLKKGLRRTHQGMIVQIERLVGSREAINEQMVDDFMEPLILGDVGVETSLFILDSVKKNVKSGAIKTPGDILPFIREMMFDILRLSQGKIEPVPERPWVVMFAGVNGSGKTTTIAKLGHRWIRDGYKVSFAAADTFRAGAIEQLRIWSERVGAGFYSGRYGADPSSVVYDAVSAAVARKEDILVIDTAGRLHTSSNLMEELGKVHRTCGKVLPGAPHEVILVLDATIGQNAIQQARNYHEALGVSGIALTKLDGTAKGGIIIAIARELSIPVKLIGVGEARDDLHDFEAREFIEALFGD